MSAARKPFDTERTFYLNSDLIQPLYTLKYNLYLVIRMAKKDTGKITITLDKTVVKMLREKKEGVETWNDLLIRLAGRSRCGIECLICGAFLENEDMNQSPNKLAETNVWRIIYSGRVEQDGDELRTKVKLGYMCRNCCRSEKN